MKSSARFWAATACVVVLSTGLKVAFHPYRIPVADNPVAMSQTLGRFLAAQGATDLTMVSTLKGPGKWNGWRFSKGGCQALAFPAPLSGEMDDAAARHAEPGDALRYVERGRVTIQPSRLSAVARHTALRVKRALGVGGRGEVFNLILIYPPACDAAARLPWHAL